MKKHSIKGSKKGFTIIELLTVMSIIFILMGLLIPKLSGYREKAQKLKIDNYARQIYMATMASYTDDGGKFEQDHIEENIENLISVMKNKKDKEDKIEVSTGRDSATVTFTVEGAKYDVIINKDGYTLSDKEVTGNDVVDNSEKII